MTQGARRILVVDDFAPWRNFFASLLEETPGWQVIGEASDGLEAVEKARELQPDLILLDVGLPKLHGIEAARRIIEVAPHSKILFVSAYIDSDLVDEAMSTGASGYILKANAGSQLLEAMATIIDGGQFVSTSSK